MEQKNSLIVQSGGPTAVINNTVIGLIDEILSTNEGATIYGAKGGINGLINGSFVNLTNLTIEDRHRLRWTPGAALGTCRHRLTKDDKRKIINVLQTASIRNLFYIGGNGSMAAAEKINVTAKQLNYKLNVIGIPTSIDNDLINTNHSPGYGSAAKFIATSLIDMKMDVASYIDAPRITIIETMGRNTGWIAAAAALADNEYSKSLIYIPEVAFHLDDCMEKVALAVKENKSLFLVVAEGLKDEKGHLINSVGMEYDDLNRPKLGGVSAYLKQRIKQQIGLEPRIIIPGIWQRSSILLASKTDINEAYNIGKEAWKCAVRGYSGYMITIQQSNETEKYATEFELSPLSEVAGKEKFVPLEWYDSTKNTMNDYFIQYVKPLIQGEMIIPMKNGLPIYQSVM